MPTYRYKAINRSGQPVLGDVAAPDEQAARRLLAARGEFVDQLDPENGAADISPTTYSKKTYRIKLSDRQRVEFISQLATALQAQLPLLTALQVVGQQNPQPRVQQLVAGLREAIRSGQTLSYAMAAYPRTFDQLHLSMVTVGEAGGRLDQSMAQLAALTERDFETRSDIMTAALYPSFVLCLGLLSVTIVVTWILPRIIETLATDVAVLPWPTRAVIAISGFLRVYGWLVTLILMGGFFILRQCKKHGTGRYLWDNIKLHIPVLGLVRRKWAVARFARTLGTLSQGGINLLEALPIVRNSLGNEVLAREVEELLVRVRSGSSMADPLRESGHFPPLLVQIVTVGEETGGLDELLLGAAAAFDKQTDVAVKRFMALFPAILILLLAVLVGFIVAATLLPIVQVETGLPGI